MSSLMDRRTGEGSLGESMQLRIVHTTGFTYSGTAAASYNEARLTPQTMAEQLVAHSRVEVSPTPWLTSYRDYFGAQVTAFEVLDPHSSLQVVSSATVHVNRTPAKAPALSWDALRNTATVDELSEFLDISDVVRAPDDLLERAHALAENAVRPAVAAREIAHLVFDEVEYVAGSTTVLTPAAQAWEQRSGVCQDMAHLTLGALRDVGIPCRYVSGYLHPSTDPQIGETVTGESHAWVEWWDDGWVGFDPTNDLELTNRHVVVATGRDYSDVRPLNGIYTGGGTSSMFVDVQVTRLA